MLSRHEAILITFMRTFFEQASVLENLLFSYEIVVCACRSNIKPCIVVNINAPL